MSDETDPKKLFSVEGMVIAVTGGGSGIGYMMVKAFADNGAAKIYVLGRSKNKLEDAAKLSPNVVTIECDVTSKEALVKAAEEVKKDSGFLNLLCCNSGNMPPSLKADPSKVSLKEYRDTFLEQNVEDWVTGFSTNAISIPFTTFAFLELLDAGNKKGNAPRRTSQVIVTTSIAGFLRMPKNFGCYATTKAAATHLIKHLSGALTYYNIRVNGLAPGFFPSELATELIAAGGEPKGEVTEEGAFGMEFVPATRLGRQEDVAGTLLYMASLAGSYMNGNIQIVDGGKVGICNATY